jgi:hypothetical protein
MVRDRRKMMKKVLWIAVALGVLTASLAWFYPRRSTHQEAFRPDFIETNGVIFNVNGPPLEGTVENMTNPWRLLLTVQGKTNGLKEVILTEARITTKEGQTVDVLPKERLRIPFIPVPNDGTVRARSFLAEAKNLPFHKDQTLTVNMKWTLVTDRSTDEYTTALHLRAFLHDWSGHVSRWRFTKDMERLKELKKEDRDFANRLPEN